MTNKVIKGKLTDLKQLVEQDKVMRLTDDNEVKFKIAFNSQLEDLYNFSILEEVTDRDLKRTLTDKEQLKLYRTLGKCIDSLVNRNITDIEVQFREKDKDDTAYDPVGGKYEQIQHFAVNGDRKFRIHGYFNNQGYFMTTRLDWCHLRHVRKDRDDNRKQRGASPA